MKKKEPTHPASTNIVHVIADVDYEKLAEAIVKAQRPPEKEKPEEEIEASKNDVPLCKQIWALLLGKKETGGAFSVGIFSVLAYVFLRVFEILLVLISLVALISVVVILIMAKWEWELVLVAKNIGTIIACVLLLIMSLTITALVHIAAGEMGKTEDRSLVFSVFSGLTSLSALIVALVALLSK